MTGVTAREWVASFYLVVGIAIVAVLGFRLVTSLALLAIVLMTMVASRACSFPDYGYWKGMQLVASINPTGETLIGQVFVFPGLAVASVYSWFLGVTWIFGGREWPRNRRMSFLHGYQEIVTRLRPKS
jgi:hypothetical protein